MKEYNMEIFIWVLMAYGMSNILVYGSIFGWLRNGLRNWGENPFAPLQFVGSFFADLLSCMMCTSTWVGFFFGLALYSPNNLFLGCNNHVSWFFDGLFASGCVWAINSIVEWFEENRPAK
jgi:hypothetical protein